MHPLALGEASLTTQDVIGVARQGHRVELGANARERLAKSRAIVDDLVHDTPEYGVTSAERFPRARMQVDHYDEDERVAYGITTGFGELARVHIPHADLVQLQRNLILSHACGVGEPLPSEVVRALLLLRANSLAVGLSGIRVEVVERILDLLNHDITPIVPSRGSLGASGDLVPLAHAALVLIGEGEATVAGERMSGADALSRAGLEPVVLQPKEGLALINGTQLMTALMTLAVHDGWTLVKTAEIAAAMSLEALLGSVSPMDERIHAARPHRGQSAVAANMRTLLSGSGIMDSHAHCHRVQDAYSLRCIPQILGPARDALAHVEEALAIEMGSATDNPLVFDDGPRSGGNFHGENLALLSAYLTPALAEVAAVAERRVARLVDPRLSEGLPAFLIENSGLNSGLMIPQYVAAALVLENQVLGHPAALGSLPTSANQEDHVSNGAVGALHLRKVLENAQRVVGIELLSAAQALDLRKPLTPATGTGTALAAVRERVAFLEMDRVLSGDIEAAAGLVADGELLTRVDEAVGPLD